MPSLWGCQGAVSSLATACDPPFRFTQNTFLEHHVTTRQQTIMEKGIINLFKRNSRLKFSPNQIFHYTVLAVLGRSVQRVGGAIYASLHLCNTASLVEMSQRWQAVGNTLSDFTDPRFEPRPPAPETNALPLDQLQGKFSPFFLRNCGRPTTINKCHAINRLANTPLWMGREIGK